MNKPKHKPIKKYEFKKAPIKKHKPKVEPEPELELPIKTEPEPKTEVKPKQETTKKYTMEDWQKEVSEHVPPGSPIPDWLAAKAPSN